MPFVSSSTSNALFDFESNAWCWKECWIDLDTYIQDSIKSTLKIPTYYHYYSIGSDFISNKKIIKK